MVVITLTTTQEYEDFIKSKDLSIIHFYAPWAEQCTQMNDVVEDIATVAEFKNVRLAKIEAENLPEVSLKAGVAAVPTILLYKNGEIIDRVEGANPPALIEKAKKQLVVMDNVAVNGGMPLEERLKKLINQAPCMLFMKGSPANPRCGFSRTIVSILDSYKADYQTFDILQDNAVREGLKKFSNWPTYPQLYLNGELIGGLDIVKEMSEAGDLESLLPKKSSEEQRS